MPARAHPHPAAAAWPPARIRARTPRLELRLPTDEEIVALGDLAVAGIHDEGLMPFASPWSDEPPDALRRSMYAWHATCRGSWTPTSWHLLLAAYVDGEPVGAQDLIASDFGTLREVETASWLGRAWQGRGLGSEMRRAVLHLAFEGLAALAASSGAYEDNAASDHVSRACGYVDNGTRAVVRRRGTLAPGGPRTERAIERRYRIEREAWLERRRDDIELHGLDPEVRATLGADTTD